MDAASPHRPGTTQLSAQDTHAGADTLSDWQHASDEVVDGKYRLIRPLGRGGMAEVWLAVHVNLKTELAIKFLSLALTGDRNRALTVLERFRFEAQISARLGARTRHIVAVHDAGSHEGIPYLVMEYVPGRTLFAEVSEKGPIDPQRFAGILDQIADALSVAHEMGIVHRDLKPSNVMVMDEPGGALTVKIADFGIAKALRADLGLDRPMDTAADLMLGSPNYMSPEQITSAVAVDVRSDVWSLGVLSYEVLTEWSPFRGNSVAEVIIAVSTRDYEPPTQIRRSLPVGLERWFARALAKEPGKRFATVGEMARAYRDALAAQEQALPAPAAKPRRPASGAVAAAAFASLATVAVISAVLWRLLDTPEATQAARALSPALQGALQGYSPPPPPREAPPPPPQEGAAAPAEQAAGAPPEPAPAQPRAPSPRSTRDEAAAPAAPAPAAPARTTRPPRRKEIDKSEIL